MKPFKHACFYLLIITLSFQLSGCFSKTEGQSRFGKDSDYYIGLKLLNEGDQKAAQAKFRRCSKKGSYYCSLKSAQKLCTFGSVAEKSAACENLLKKTDDPESLLIIVKHFSEIRDFTKVLSITNNLESKDKAEEINQLIKFRLIALKQTQSSDYYQELYDWFSKSKISTDHYQYYRDFLDHPNFTSLDNNSEIPCTPQEFAINYRIELYKRNYLYCFESAATILDYFEKGILPVSDQLASDIGKAYLYGNTEMAANALFFEQLARKFSSTPAEFYFWFYSGRLYEKAAIYYQKSKRAFENAILCADTPTLKDNAIWYLLNTSLNYSLESTAEEVVHYASKWNDPEYFDDFFDSLSVAIFATGDWNLFGRIYKAIDGYASDSIVAQFAYIYGRLLQEKVAAGTTQDIIEAFKCAYNKNSSLYYKILSKYQYSKLGFATEEFDKLETSEFPESKQIDYDAQKLLEGYAYFGFPELIYDTWLKIGKNRISEDSAEYLSKFLNKCSKGDDDYLHQSLRIGVTSRSDYKSNFPQNYKDSVEKYSQEYGVEASAIYALIRSESFFDSDVVSSAGAIGLTQLMEFTGNDIARKLKVSDYSLTDPETNIQFGTYYLADLIRRSNNSYLLGFFSYNAGITRVRRWLQTSVSDFGKKSRMPLDLFLESLPYAETREYGRKLVSSTTLYEWLYSDDKEENTKKIIQMLISDD